MTIEIELTKGYVAIVDDCDADLAEFEWCAFLPTPDKVYAKRNVLIGTKQKTIYMHRLILERILKITLLPKQLCDHENNDGLDNRRANLRVASHQGNKANSKKCSSNTTGFKGVHYVKDHKKFAAVIGVGRKSFFLGYHTTPEEAFAAYCKAGRELHGEFFNPGDNS